MYFSFKIFLKICRSVRPAGFAKHLQPTRVEPLTNEIITDNSFEPSMKRILRHVERQEERTGHQMTDHPEWDKFKYLNGGEFLS